jgi:hypothetical protein
MDAKRFDAWTRRRFGLGASGLAASLLGFQGLDEAEGKKKNHKHKNKGKHKHKGQKCKKAGTGCKPKKRRCCNGLACQAVPGFGGLRCCAGAGAECLHAQDCCSGTCIEGECSFAS